MTQGTASRRKSYPKHLTEASPEDRVAYFKNYLVTHPMLNLVDRKVWTGIQSQDEGTLYFVIGPTGVGKTTLRHALERRLNREAQRRSPTSPPFLSVEVPACEGGRFKWTEFFRTALKAAFGPPPKDLQSQNLSPNHQAIFLSRPHREFYFRDQLLDWFHEHRPKAFFIDETQHLSSSHSPGRLLDQMDVLKSFANLARTPLVLFGTYDLLASRNLNAQLSRRSVDIHFSRYGRDATGVKAFLGVLLTFEKQLPVRLDFNLLDHADFLYAHSAGCVGILKDWLTHSLRAALYSNHGILNVRLLQQAAPCIGKAHRIATESIAGELKWDSDLVPMERLYQLLGIPLPLLETPSNPAVISQAPIVVRQPGQVIPSEGGDDQNGVYATVTAIPKLPRPIVGRKPKRDPIGRQG